CLAEGAFPKRKDVRGPDGEHDCDAVVFVVKRAVAHFILPVSVPFPSPGLREAFEHAVSSIRRVSCHSVATAPGSLNRVSSVVVGSFIKHSLLSHFAGWALIARLWSTGITTTVNGVPASSDTWGSAWPNSFPPSIEFS